MISLLHDFYDSKCFLIVVMGFGIYMFVTLQEPWVIGIANGQEVNRTEESSRQAKEILCKEFNFEYCYGQEVSNNDTSTNSTNSAVKSKPELECFSLGNYFSEYYEFTRCRLS